MSDKNKYKILISKSRQPAFENRELLVDYIVKCGPLRIERITFNNTGMGRQGDTGWVDGKTLLGIWQDVEKKKIQLATASKVT